MAEIRWTLSACLALAACGGGDAAKTAANDGAKDAPIAPVQQSAAEKRDTAWVVTPEGIGPVRVGMRASEALGVTVDVSGAPLTETCAYVKAGRVPPGVGVLANGGVVARIDVDSGTVATTEGARIGDPEARIRQLYAGLVTEQPHKYTSGRYLIVIPADTSRRLVFETDGSVVKSYRAGRRPEVDWVERCG